MEDKSYDVTNVSASRHCTAALLIGLIAMHCMQCLDS